MNDLKIYAHRCAPMDGPENDLRSAAKAITAGADGFECDVRLSKDGEPVVIHDADLSRLFPGFKVKKRNGEETNKIAEIKFKDLTAVNLPNGGKISHLYHFLKLAEDRRAKIFIELKESSPELLARVAGEIKMRQNIDAVVISFKENDLKEIGKAGIRTGLIVGSLRQIINFRKLFSFEKIAIYDYLFFGWDSEEPHTKWEFKVALWYLWLRRILPLPEELRWMVYSGIVQNKKELEYLRKWGFSNVFTDTMKIIE